MSDTRLESQVEFQNLLPDLSTVTIQATHKSLILTAKYTAGSRAIITNVYLTIFLQNAANIFHTYEMLVTIKKNSTTLSPF
jgi:hypothetical protein